MSTASPADLPVAAVTTLVANPFPGLRPFEPSESHLFFGRDEQVDELLVRLQRLRFLAAVGTSGCGKSSLILAGLLPALHRGCLPSSGSRWRIARSRPGDAPMRNLALSLAAPEALGALLPAEQVNDLEATLRRTSLGLVQAVLAARLPPSHNLLVVVDQFEELFSFKRLFDKTEGEEPAAFLKLLLAAVQQSEVPISIVLTMRSDFLGDCAQFPNLPEALNDAQYLVPRLTRDQRQECIEGPVAVGGASITPRLVQRLLNDVGDDPDHLPVLQHALMRTWEASRADREHGQPVDMRHYEKVGGMAKALDRHAEEAYHELGPADLAIAPKVFQCLAERGQGGRETRRPQRLAALAEVAGVAPPQVRAVVEPFLSRGPFLTIRGEELVVDISHESFIRLWKRLGDWVRDEARAARTYRRLVERAGLWATAPDVSKFEGLELKDALKWERECRPTPAWASRYDPRLDLALRFLRASQKSRRRLWVGLLGGLSATFAIVTVFALWQWRNAESSGRAARSLVSLRTDPEASLRLAIEAFETAETEAAAEALREALAVSLIRKEWSVPLERATAVAFSPDGTQLAAAGGAAGRDEPGRGGIWNVETGKLSSKVCGLDVVALRWTPDGKRLLVGLQDGGVVVWDPAAKEPGLENQTALIPGPQGGQLWDMDLRPDGRELAIAAGTEGLWRFELSLGSGRGPVRARPKPTLPLASSQSEEVVASVAYSQDGSRLAVASGGKVKIVDTRSGQTVCETRPLEVDILRVGFSGAELGQVGASSFDDVVRSWTIERCQVEADRFVGHRRPVTAFAFTDNGGFLATVSQDGTMRLWDTETDEEVSIRRMARQDAARKTIRYQFHNLAAFTSGASLPEDARRNYLATTGAEPEAGASPAESLTLWDIASRKQADLLKPRSSGRSPEESGRDLLGLARGRWRQSRMLTDQAPRCP